MPPEKKSTWQKLTSWPVMVLLISLGLHGLLLLVPLSESQEPEETSTELPEPIQVTDLPPNPQLSPESGLVNPAFAPLIQAPPSSVDQPSSPLVVNLPATQAPQPSPQPNPQPSPQPNPQPNPQPPPNQPPTPQPQPYDPTGTNSDDQRNASGTFASRYGKSKDVSTLLDLGYPANNNCFDRGTAFDAIAAISVNQFGEIDYGQLLRKTGYPIIDTWLTTFITRGNPTPLPEDVFIDLQQTVPTAPSSGDVIDWLNAVRDNKEEPLTQSDSQAYAFEISVIIEDNSCEPPEP